MKRTLKQRMLSILLSACMMLGLFVSLQGTKKVEAASEDMYEYTLPGNVTVKISKTGDYTYNKSPFGYDTRGGYVFAKIDVTGSGHYENFWLSPGGPCGDGTSYNSWDDYVASGKLKGTIQDGEEKPNVAYGNYEQSMFWFSEKDFDFNGSDSVAGNLIEEYLLAYMEEYFNYVYAVNFDKEEGVHCDVVWGNAVQVPSGIIVDELIPPVIVDPFDPSTWTPPKTKFIDYPLSLNKAGTDMLRTSTWTVHADGTGVEKDGTDSIGTRVSSTFKSHCGGSTAEELICYSSSEMDNATKRICGADGKSGAVNKGNWGKGLKSDTPTGLATPKTSKYITEHWNAAVIVKIPDVKKYTKVKLAFYDIDTLTQVGSVSANAVASGALLYNSETTVTNWSSDIPKGYALSTGNLDKYPAFHVGSNTSGVNFVKYASISGKGTKKKIGSLNDEAPSYYIDNLFAKSHHVVWIPVEKKSDLYVQYYDVSNDTELGNKKIRVGQIPYNSMPGDVEVVTLLKNNYGDKWNVDWDKATSINGFFAVRGDSENLYKKLATAKDTTVADKYANTYVTKNNPYVNLTFTMSKKPYTVLWVPVTGEQQQVEIVYIDSEDGTVIGDPIIDDTVTRNQTYTPVIPSGYEVDESGKYKSKGAKLESATAFIKTATNDYATLLDSPNTKLTYNATTYAFRVPSSTMKYVSCKLYIPLKKIAGALPLYIHYYDADTDKRIDTNGTKTPISVYEGKAVPEFCITDVKAIPAGYEYRGDAPMTVCGTNLTNVAHNLANAKGQTQLNGTITVDGVKLNGKTTKRISSGSKYVCMWVPVRKIPGSSAQVTVEFINSNTGVVIPDSKTQLSAKKGSTFVTLEEVDVPDGYTVDNTGTYKALAAYSKTIMPLDCTYSQMGSYTSISFLEYNDFSVVVPNDASDKLGVKIFIPVKQETTTGNEKKVNIIYYNVNSGEIIEKGPSVKISGDKNTYTPASVKDTIVDGYRVFKRVVASTYMYYTVKKEDISGVAYKDVGSKGLIRGTVVANESATVNVPATATELTIYVGMNVSGDYTVSLYYVDADTGVTIDKEERIAQFTGGTMFLEFDNKREIVYDEKRYSPVSAEKDDVCKYPSRAYYMVTYNYSGVMDVSYDYCKNSNWFTNIANSAMGGKVRFNDNSLVFGPIPYGTKPNGEPYDGNVINVYVPCVAAKRVEIHCVASDKKDSTDFIASYDLWVGEGETVKQKLETYVIDGVVYRPDLTDVESPYAIIQPDNITTLSFNAARSSKHTQITSYVSSNGVEDYEAQVNEAKTLDKHTVMYVVYSPDDPKVIVKYVTIKDGDIDKELLTKNGGTAKYNKTYSYTGDKEITVDGKKYVVTGEDEVLAYGDYDYTSAIVDTKNKKGVQVTYDGDKKWTTEKVYKSHDDGVLYIPVEEDGYPVTVVYITLKADGTKDKEVLTLDGGKAVVDKKYSYNGDMTIIGTDGKKYTVLGEKESFAYNSNTYKAALNDTGNTKGMPVTYSAGISTGTWTTSKKVKKATKATLYIPVKTGIPVTIIYIDSEDGTPIQETPGKPAEPGKKYETPYLPAIPVDEETTYIPDPSNPPTVTWKEEPYPGPVVPVNDPDEPSVTTPKVPSGTPSIIIYIPMKKDEVPEEPEGADVSIEKVPDVKAKIKSKLFDVEVAIPSTEYEYAEIKADAYTIKVKMHAETGSKQYTINGTQQIVSAWDVYGPDPNDPTKQIFLRTDYSTSSTTATSTVTRTYKYWVIDEIGYYTLNNIKIDNGSIDETLKYIVTAKDIVFPELTYTHSDDIKAHITEPQTPAVKNITVPTKYYYNGSYSSGPECGTYVAQEAQKIKKIKCKNDSLIFDGETVLDNKAVDEAAPDPDLAPVEKNPPRLDLESPEVQIPDERKNIDYDDSKGFAFYQPKVVFNSPNKEQKIEIPDINKVKVHTPVYNETKVKEDNLQYVQDVNADKKKYHVVVGRSESYGSTGNENITSDFSIEVKLNGQHISAKGYGNRNYDKYILGHGGTVNNTSYPKGVQVKFPIDVVADVGNDKNEANDVVLEADKWYSIYARYYVPEWVAEGTYTCEVRVLACNAKGDYDAMENKANLSDSNYAASQTFELEVSGKMYGLTLTSNNSVAPDWKDVFTLNGKIKNAYPGKYADGTFGAGFDKDWRYYYMAGLKNEIGLDMWAVANKKTVFKDSKYIYPLLAGSSPALKGSGMLKSGYTWNFKLETVGRKTANEASNLVVVPSFYWVSKDGTKHEPVDMWYADKVDGKTYNYIKAGSDLDKKNVFIDYAASETMGIPAKEIEFVDAIRKQKNPDDDSTISNTPIYTYGSIVLSKNTKTYTNDTYAKLFAAKQSTFNETQLKQLKQTWYFKYGLPDIYHLCPKDYDLETYIKKNGGCTYKEDFWKKDGYLVVHFDIGAYDKDGNLVLMYTNTEQNVIDGMCDMWKMEGYQNIRTDSTGKKFDFVDGDVIIVALPGSTGKNPPANKSEDKETNRLN